MRRCRFWLNPFTLSINNQWKLMGYAVSTHLEGGEKLAAKPE